MNKLSQIFCCIFGLGLTFAPVQDAEVQAQVREITIHGLAGGSVTRVVPFTTPENDVDAILRDAVHTEIESAKGICLDQIQIIRTGDTPTNFLIHTSILSTISLSNMKRGQYNFNHQTRKWIHMVKVQCVAHRDFTILIEQTEGETKEAFEARIASVDTFLDLANMAKTFYGGDLAKMFKVYSIQAFEIMWKATQENPEISTDDLVQAITVAGFELHPIGGWSITGALLA